MSADEPVGLTRCPSSRSRRRRSPWGVDFMAITEIRVHRHTRGSVETASFARDLAEDGVDQEAQPSPYHFRSIG